MGINETVKTILFGASEFDFHWFLAGPIAIPARLADRVVKENYAWCLDDEIGLLWRPVISRELGRYGMGTVDPYSSSVCEVLDLMGEKEGYKQVIRACNGVVACLLPYHWECIPRREQHLRIALDTFGYPFVVYSPDINLSPNERSTVKEVKRLMSVIPTCIRMKNAIQKLADRGIQMTTTTKDTCEEEPQYVMVTCNSCGASYKSAIIIEGGARIPVDKCPVCEKRLLVE